MNDRFSNELTSEAGEILSILKNSIPQRTDGKEAILELKRIDYQWRQMEWIGWYFEHLLYSLLTAKHQGKGGPTFGNTSFDYKKKFVWDFKAHPTLTPNGKQNDRMILNDREAIELCVQKYGGIGFIVVHGSAVFDETGEFKAWHDALKGKISSYEIERIRRGAHSRKRKCAFEIEQVEAIFFHGKKDLDRGVTEGWLDFFQEGMRNADGSPRRPKYELITSRAPESIRPVPPVQFASELEKFR